MPILFAVIGIIFFSYIFYAKQKSVCLIFSFLLALLGFFVGCINIAEIRVNIANILSIIFLVVYLIRNVRKKCFKNTAHLSLIILSIYALFNYISIDFNYFFSVIPVCLFAFVVCVFERSFFNRVLIGVISVIMCDIYNYIFLINKIDFVTLFSYEFMFCIVVIITANCALEILKIRSREVEKVG